MAKFFALSFKNPFAFQLVSLIFNIPTSLCFVLWLHNFLTEPVFVIT